MTSDHPFNHGLHHGGIKPVPVKKPHGQKYHLAPSVVVFLRRSPIGVYGLAKGLEAAALFIRIGLPRTANTTPVAGLLPGAAGYDPIKGRNGALD